MYIFTELKCVTVDLFNGYDTILKRIEGIEKETKKSFYFCGLNIDKLRAFYEKYVSNMELQFVDAVKASCVGYAFNGSLPINMVSSINEMLHLIHAYVVNNNNILQSLPPLAEKQNDYGYPITLRGTATEISQKLFDDFPKDLDVAWTDIVSIDDKKILMMVRDRGRALTIEIT